MEDEPEPVLRQVSGDFLDLATDPEREDFYLKRIAERSGLSPFAE